VSVIVDPFKLEDPMTTNEFYYLLLVCGAFAVFGISLALAYLRYKQWLKQQARVTSRAAETLPPSLRGVRRPLEILEGGDGVRIASRQEVGAHTQDTRRRVPAQ
jgi:hypothetical protein